MVVPVSLRPDRRGEVFIRGRGWVPREETREYQERKQRQQAKEEYWERKAQEHQIRCGFQMLFGGN